MGLAIEEIFKISGFQSTRSSKQTKNDQNNTILRSLPKSFVLKFPLFQELSLN